MTMPKIYIRRRRIGWRFAFDYDGQVHRGWRPTRRWANRAAIRVARKAR
jgi:hypothetical protein